MPRVILIRLRLQRILTDDIQSAEVSTLHRFEHLREVPAFFGRNLSTPMFLELFTERDVLDVLKTRQAIRQGTHIARSEEHTSELQSHHDLVCRRLLAK